MNTRTVLVVENEPAARADMAAWLEADGFEVLACPGPTEPDYTCIGDQTAYCPLAASADIVVLNLRLAPETAVMGTPSWHLLTTYFALGKQVIALTGEGDAVRPRSDEQVLVLPRPVHRKELMDAIAEARQRITRSTS